MYAIGDQALSSLTNLLGNVAVAATASVAEYGAFGLATATLLLVSSVLRGMFTEPLLVRYSQDPESDGRAVWFCLWCGLPLSLVGAMALTTPNAGAARPVWVFLAPLLALEGFRYHALGRGLPRRAFLIDLVWLVSMVIGLAGALVLGRLEPALASWIWTLSGGLALGVALVRYRLWPRFGVWRFLRLERDVSLPWGLEYLATKGLAQGLTFLIAATFGLAGAAAYRGGMVLLGPLTVVMAGLRFAAMPGMLGARPDEVPRRARSLAVTFFTFSLLLGAPLLWLPEQVGESLLGDSWPAALLILPWLLAYRASSSATVGPMLGLRALEKGTASLSVRLTTSGLTLGATGAAMMFGASLTVVVALLAASSVATLPLWFRQLRG